MNPTTLEFSLSTGALRLLSDLSKRPVTFPTNNYVLILTLDPALSGDDFRLDHAESLEETHQQKGQEAVGGQIGGGERMRSGLTASKARARAPSMVPVSSSSATKFRLMTVTARGAYRDRHRGDAPPGQW
jgi:hypothetical protein